ncbi:hypothetical protein Cob_v004797 [Colletotrichum orbiculare MAFF 240422]|uniref:Had-superfamily subfamily variant 1 n=1 Tax=Colletotrichum orbiculare (strain 104-T / ATCC 96160 / CBS 514.97 / LARS 414 / MAFF 240422) TaxID=1213857 RepID=A0A484FY59_COLOR|nr:hypothetical protein Cob_v004797 [Colletotrichum orbiculare MAFF 240422]
MATKLGNLPMELLRMVGSHLDSFTGTLSSLSQRTVETVPSEVTEKKLHEDLAGTFINLCSDVDFGPVHLAEYIDAANLRLDKNTIGLPATAIETATADLKDAYAEIIRDKTLNAFSGGKTSFEYRRDRFAALLERFSLPQDADFLSELLAIYEEALARSLQLKDGALSLLSTLRRVGKKIAVVTEGPQDAQERTVEQLGLAEYVDFLATTNFFRVSKVDGLFPKVLEHLQISAADMVFIGDSSSRDMIPAGEANILCILYAEEAESSWKTQPPQVNSLREIEALVS